MQEPNNRAKLKTSDVSLYYGAFHALNNVTMEIPERSITAIIGPSGCGKSSLLRIFNRMNDLIPGARVEGGVFLDGSPVYAPGVDVVALRQKVGMVFQKPNPFPMSIFDNVAIGPRRLGERKKAKLAETVERSLTAVALWEEIKDMLKKSALSLSPGQQQRLCIARALAIEPQVILFDESCSALDPESTMRIEDLMVDLAQQYTILIVTHNMEQALRISDMSAFLMLEDKGKPGTLVEFSPTADLFANPQDKRTEDYITGRYG